MYVRFTSAWLGLKFMWNHKGETPVLQEINKPIPHTCQQRAAEIRVGILFLINKYSTGTILTSVRGLQW